MALLVGNRIEGSIKSEALSASLNAFPLYIICHVLMLSIHKNVLISIGVRYSTAQLEIK